MDIKDFLSKVNIPKVIDSGAGAINSGTNVPQNPPAPPSANAPTPISTLTNDLSSQILRSQQAVNNAMTVLKAQNNNQTFNNYSTMVDSSVANALAHIPSSGLYTYLTIPIMSNVFTSAQIQKAERNVFRTSQTVSAPFYQDLGVAHQQVAVSNYSFQNTWSKLLNSTALYSEFDPNNRIIKLNLYKELENLQYIENYANNVINIVAQPINSAGLEAVIRNVLNGIYYSGKTTSVGKSAETINSIIYSLSYSLTNLNSEWERHTSTVAETFGGIRNALSMSNILGTTYRLIGGMQNPVYDFTGTLQNSFNSPDPDVAILQTLIEHGMNTIVQKGEESLLHREGLMYTTNEARNMMTSVAVKANLTKTYLALFTSILPVVSSLGKNLPDFNTLMGGMMNTATQGISNWNLPLQSIITY